MKKLLNILLLLCCMVTVAWADDDHQLAIEIANNRTSQLADLVHGDGNRLLPNGHTMLIWAIRNHSWRAYDWILTYGNVNVNETNKFGENALMYFALLGDLPHAKELLHLGAKVNQIGWLPLHYAVMAQKPAMVRFLLQHGSWVDFPDPLQGRTPLFLAVEYNCYQCLQLLLQHKADPKIRSSAGLTPLDLAKIRGMTEFVTRLEQH